MNFMPADAFERLRVRKENLGLLMETPSMCDPEIAMAVTMINKHPSLITIASRKGEVGKNTMGSGKIVVGVLDDAGLRAMFRIQAKLIELRGNPYATALITEYKKDITLNEKGSNAAAYPVWILKWTFHAPECPKIYDLINNASLVVLEDM